MNEMLFLAKGMMFGLGISLMLGPLFFFMIQSGIEFGFRKGKYFAIGTWISDLCFILTTYFAFSYIEKWIKNEDSLHQIKLFAGIILIIIGIFSLPFLKLKARENSSKSKWNFLNSNLLLKGFVINTLNPNALLIWFGAAAILLQPKAGIESNNQSSILYYFGIQMMIISTDILKVYFGAKIKHVLTSNHMFYIRIISAMIFLLFGIYLLVSYNSN